MKSTIYILENRQNIIRHKIKSLCLLDYILYLLTFRIRILNWSRLYRHYHWNNSFCLGTEITYRNTNALNSKINCKLVISIA